MGPKNFIVAILLGLALAAGIFVAWRTQAPPPEAQSALVLPEPTPLPGFELLDHRGETVDESVFEGQWDLVFFGFTHCPDICPTTLQVLSAARAALAESGRERLPRIVLVSVDPERDTPEILAPYVGYFGESTLGITGSLDEIRKLTSGLGIYFEKRAPDGDNYLVDHSAAVLLIDPEGRFSAVFGGPHRVADYVRDLPIVMRGS